jgi:hypothetical protein
MQTALTHEIPLKIKTFSNAAGASAFFKALGHPLTAPKMHQLIRNLSSFRSVTIYDPLDQAGEVEALYDFSGVNIVHVFAQNIINIGKQLFGLTVQPVTALENMNTDALFITAFDATRLVAQIRHILPAHVKIFSLDDVRLPDEFLTNPRNYLDHLNFATNFVFFREEANHHTRLVTANYWTGYNAKNAGLWCCLFDGDGHVLSEWKEKLGPTVHTITIDSQRIRQQYNLGTFTGSLFVHFTGVAGHDVVKYALDTYGDDHSVLSCTHDANAWPADLYAGLPAPRKGERVILWVQNSHPCPIPSNSIGLNIMGSDEIKTFDKTIAPFATCAVDVADLWPGVQWPQQLEVQAGKYFVRPRYEVIAANGRSLIAHTNVERTDLKVDPGIPTISHLMGKGFLLPAPILPIDRFKNIILPTPMSTIQDNLPLALIIYNSQGKEITRHKLGLLNRGQIKDISINDLLENQAPNRLHGFGHMELVYDFMQGGNADGWLHALLRYEDTLSGHAAETSFGAHIFNTVLVYKNEPQSYAGRPPGLSTRLFLRLSDDEAVDTLCHLIYPSSTPWHKASETDLILCDANGADIFNTTVHIPCSGSMLWSYHDMFDKGARRRAGKAAYVVIRDTTCRLFGYHGLIRGEQAFSFDHMFGF